MQQCCKKILFFYILGSIGYTQEWLRGDEVQESEEAHPHEGLRLMDKSGWIAGTMCFLYT